MVNFMWNYVLRQKHISSSWLTCWAGRSCFQHQVKDSRWCAINSGKMLCLWCLFSGLLTLKGPDGPLSSLMAANRMNKWAVTNESRCRGFWIKDTSKSVLSQQCRPTHPALIWCITSRAWLRPETWMLHFVHHIYCILYIGYMTSILNFSLSLK